MNFLRIYWPILLGALLGLVISFALFGTRPADAGSYSSSRSSFSSSRSYSSPSRSYSAPRPSYSKPSYVAPQQRVAPSRAYSPAPRTRVIERHTTTTVDSGNGMMTGLLLGTVLSGNHSAPAAPVIINGQPQAGIAPTPQSTYLQPAEEPAQGLTWVGILVLLLLLGGVVYWFVKRPR